MFVRRRAWLDMMGRQITICLGRSDQQPFEDALRAAAEFAIVTARPDSPEPELLSTTVVREFGKEPLRVLLARPSDLSTISFSKIPGRAEYSYDQIVAPTIEFDRTFIGDGFIRPGRLYYIPRYYD